MRTLQLGLGLTVCLFLAGCQSLEDDVDDCLFSLKHHWQAHQRWREEKPKCPDVSYPRHYGCGFRAGYRDVATGGSGCLPPLPPQRYTKVWYQSPAGHEKTYNWYSGFSYGAAAAMQESANHWSTVPPSPQFAYSQQMLKDGLRNGSGRVTPIPDVPPAPASPPALDVPDVPTSLPVLPVPNVPAAPAAPAASSRPVAPGAAGTVLIRQLSAELEQQPSLVLASATSASIPRRLKAKPRRLKAKPRRLKADASADGWHPTRHDGDGKPRAETSPPRPRRVSAGDQSSEESNEATKNSE